MRKPTSTRGGAQHYCALAPHIRTWTLAGRLVELLGDSPGAYSVADLAELLDTDVRAVQRKLAQLRADGVLIERLQWDGRTPLATYRAIKGGAR